MNQNTQQPFPDDTLSNKSITEKKWYHLRLLPKFAFIFLLVVALPIIVSAIYISYKSESVVMDSLNPFIEQVKGSINTQAQQGNQEWQALFDTETNQEFADLQKQVLSEVQEKFLTTAVSLSAKHFPIDNSQISGTVETRLSAYKKEIEDALSRVIQQEITATNQKIAENLAKRQQIIRDKMQSHREYLIEGVSEQITITIKKIAEDVRQKTIRHVLPILVVIGIFTLIVGMTFTKGIVYPIKRMTVVARNISQGDVTTPVPVVSSHDEIGKLSRSFQATTQYLQNIVRGAQKISEGELSHEVIPVSDKDALGIAFDKMMLYLRDIAGLATHISCGDFKQVVMPKSETDVLGNAVYRMTLYLQKIAQLAKKVAVGDLSEYAAPLSEKDFLGNAFSDMIDRLRTIVAKIRTGANQLATVSVDAHKRAQEESESVEKISTSVEETSSSMTEMASSIGEVSENMKHLSSFFGEASSSIEEMNSSIRQIASHSEQLGMASEETSTSIQEISASLQQIAETAKHSKMLSDGAVQDAIDGREAVEKMIRSMNVIQHTVTVTADAIQLLNRRTESIEKILNVIKDISDQTSLLSINASIIAKKAGERGRGFNVIADKVRKLADQSTLSAKEIARIIRDVRKESAHAVEVVATGNDKVQEGVKLAQLAGKALDKIITGADASSSVISKIAETTDEQTKISQHIIESMEQVVEMVKQIKYATKEQEQSSAYLMKQSEQVLLLSQQVTLSTREQRDMVTHVLSAMDNIRKLIQMTSARAKESTEAASVLLKHAEALKHVVSQFTI